MSENCKKCCVSSQQIEELTKAINNLCNVIYQQVEAQRGYGGTIYCQNRSK